MKRTNTLILSIIMIIGILFASAFPSSASEISPRLSNCHECTINFGIVDGTAHVVVGYTGKADTFTQIKVTVKIQKRFLLVFWSTVDIGEPNNEWIATSTDLDGYLMGEFDVNSTGTYRAVFTIEVYGTGGVTDVMEETIECTY